MADIARLSGRPEHNLAAGFWKNQASHPERTALVVAGERYSYGDLARQASRIAGWIGASSRRTARVGILATRSLETYAGFLATLLANRTFVPLHPKYPPEYLRGILRSTGVGLLIVDREREPLLTPDLVGDAALRVLSPLRPATQGRGTLSVEGEDRIAACRPLDGPVPASLDDRAYILFTSGSTGVPKGISGSVGNVAVYHAAIGGRYGFTPEDRFSQNMEIDFDPFTFELLAAWNAGASVHVPNAIEVVAPVQFINAQGITVWYGGPSIIGALERMKLLAPGVLATLRLSMFVGEPLTSAAAEAWRRAAPNSVLENEYAPTEVHGICLAYRLDPAARGVGGPQGLVPLGTPLPGMNVATVDRDRRFLPPGESGEIAIAGPQVTAGYWKKPSLTRARFRTLDHPRWGRAIWYLTGDRGLEEPAGIFNFLGRLDNQVKILGHRVELAEVEFHLRNLVGPRGEVAAVAWPLVNGSAQGLVAFVAGPDIDPERVRAGMRALVPPFMAPRIVRLLEAMPRNIHGKIDRRALLDRLDQGLKG